MKIKTKLALNSVTILILMAVITAAAVIGINFIQKNIFNLTQKSTPYQIKTFNHQRALQAHASNLLKVAASGTVEEFKLNSSKSAESLAEEIQAAEDLTKLGSVNDYGHAQFTENTKSIRDITDKRLALQRDTLTAVAAMKNSLLLASGKLQGLDASIRKLQHKATTTMVSNIYSNASNSDQAAIASDLIDAIKDIKAYSIQVLQVTDREVLDSMYANLSISITKMQQLRRITWSDSRANENFDKRLDHLSDQIAETNDQSRKFLASNDASARAKAVQANKAADQEINFILAGLRAESEKFVYKQNTGSEAMAESVTAFSATNTILILSSETIFSSEVIGSLINYSLSIRNLPDFDKNIAAIQNELGKADSSANKLKALLVKGKFKTETRMLSDSLGALEAVKTSFLGKDGAADKMRASLKNVEEVAKLNQKMKEMVAAQMELSSKDVAVAQQSQESTVGSVRKAVKTTTTLIMAIALVAVLASLVIGKVIASSITGPILELSKMAEGFGAGNFNIRMDETRKDEFGAVAGHFNQATAKLSDITKLLKESIAKLSEGSGYLNKTADYLYKGAQEQVSQTTQSSVAMTEISATVQTVAGHAHSSAASSQEAHSMATTGKAVVAKTVRGMQEIYDSVIVASTSIEKLSESSQTIDSILSTINDIADQTNLLALNAAIEAARAGEHGMGFAVVADEVRKLAQRTAGATHEIADIIHVIQADTKKSVSAMNDGKTKVEEGMKLSGEASQSLDAIVGVSQRGVDMAQMIARATDDQSTASREVSQSMERIANITGSLKDSTVEIKDASGQLANIAQELNRMASWFQMAA